MNAKYATIQEIFARVTSVIKQKKINAADVVEWAVQCETEYIDNFESYFLYLKVKLDVRDKMARVPYFKARILDVYQDPDKKGSQVNYYDSGRYLILDSSYDKDYIYINFIGIPIDEDSGYPLIRKGHEEACVAHIICNLYREDFYNGKINQAQWYEMKEERRTQVEAAKYNFGDYSRRDLDNIKAITLNKIPAIDYDSLYHQNIS